MFRVLLCVGMLAGLLGCNGGGVEPLPKTAPGSGQVKLDGKPIGGAMVTFSPKAGTSGVECIGTTDDEGKYVLKQVRGGEGVPPGEYTVFINRYVDAKGIPIELDDEVAPADQGAVESLPAKYSSPIETTLSQKVPESGGEFNFDLTSR